MEDCEQYRKDLIRYCHQFFEYEYEYAEDCVQEAYVALLESLNNGIEIKPQDKERIFELRFSRKPNGRGLGLSISKEVLNAENYDIFVAQPKEGSTVTFKIQKMQ